MESSPEDEIVPNNELRDIHVDVDFSFVTNGDGNQLSNNENEQISNEYPSAPAFEEDSASLSDSDSGDDDGNDVPAYNSKSVAMRTEKKCIIQEENIETVYHNACITCNTLDKQMLDLQRMDETPGNEDDETAYEFVHGNLKQETLPKNAKLIVRSDSEMAALQAVDEGRAVANQAEGLPCRPTDDLDGNVNNIGLGDANEASETTLKIEKKEMVTSLNEKASHDIADTPRFLQTANVETEKIENESQDVENTDSNSNSQNSQKTDGVVDVETSASLPNNKKHLHNDSTSENSRNKLSPRTWRKRAMRLPAGKRHSRTVFQEDILSAYDIIDRKDVKEMKNQIPTSSIFSLASFRTKVKRVLSLERRRISINVTSPITSPTSKHGPQNIIKMSVEETPDGEPIQVITFAHCDEPNLLPRKRDSSMIIYIDEEESIGQDSYEDFSDVDSDRSSVVDLDVTNDMIDYPGKKSGSYEVSNVDDEKQEDEDSVEKLPNTSRFKGPTRESRSFGGADKVPHDINMKEPSRRTTLDGSQIKSVLSDPNLMMSIVPIDPHKNRLKKKTLPNEPFHCITDGYPTVLPSFPSDRRSLIALEIYTTERTFVRGLEIIVLLFKARMELSGILDPKEVKSVFSNAGSILEFNRGVLDELFERISSWSDEQCIGDIFLQRKDDFKMYAEYCKSYDSGESLIKQKLKKKKDLENLLNMCYTNPVCLPGLTLPSYLITVIQRIPRYVLLLKDLHKRTSNDHPDFQNLSEALSAMAKTAEFINDQLKQAQCAKALEALQTQITGIKAYYIPERKLVHEGSVCLLTSKKTYQCVLFNDLLVFAGKEPNKQSSVELALELKTVWVEDLKTLDPQTTKNDAIGVYTPDRPYTMYVGSSGEKKIWLGHLKKAIGQFLYPDCDDNDDVGLEKRKSNYTYKGGALYDGTYVNAKRHGEGTMLFPNYMTYRGCWQDDERNGFGVLEFSTGQTYEGTWRDDKQDGLGTFKYANGDTLSGEWEDGLRHGEIFINYENGDKFAGKCYRDCIEGEGELICMNGVHYKGQWRKNLKHGKGTLKMGDGSEYNGYFLRGKFHGQGELLYPSGATYKGEFERGDRCGQGTYVVPNGCVYEGQWMHDMKDGNGKMTYENGDVYDGTWVQDMRIGVGRLSYNCGGWYRGQWAGDLRHGSGIMEFKDRSTYDGEWRNGKMNGSGKIKYKNGNIFQGLWKDNMPNGRGISTKPGGWSCDGHWEQGKQHGKCTLSDPFNKYSYEGDWVNGHREGRGIEKTRDHVYEGDFMDDLRDGFGVEKFNDGSAYEGHWRRGQKHGRGIRKLANGLKEDQWWQNGCLVKSPVLLTPREIPAILRWV